MTSAVPDPHRIVTATRPGWVPEKLPFDTVAKMFWHRVKELGDQVMMRQKDLGIWKAVTWTELGRQARVQPVQAERPQHLPRLGLGRRAPGAVDDQAVGHVLEHRHVREQGVGLEHHVDRPQVSWGRGHVLAVDQDAPGIGYLEPGQHAKQRGLAAARAAQKGEQLAARHVEIDAVHRHDRAEAPGQALDPDDGFAHWRLTHRRPSADAVTGRS